MDPTLQRTLSSDKPLIWNFEAAAMKPVRSSCKFTVFFSEESYQWFNDHHDWQDTIPVQHLSDLGT